jgi:hypothetical protein
LIEVPLDFTNFLFVEARRLDRLLLLAIGRLHREAPRAAMAAPSAIAISDTARQAILRAIIGHVLDCAIRARSLRLAQRPSRGDLANSSN